MTIIMYPAHIVEQIHGLQPPTQTIQSNPCHISQTFLFIKHYDAHHLTTELGKFQVYTIDVIANTVEKYISFIVKKQNCPIKRSFLDSFQFLPTSLQKLTPNLKPTDFHLNEKIFRRNRPLIPHSERNISLQLFYRLQEIRRNTTTSTFSIP